MGLRTHLTPGPTAEFFTSTEPSAPSQPHGRWIGAAERPLMAWVSAPERWAGQSGVLILPPVGYPYWSSHRTLRVLAERLADAGHLALRLDYDATGDSAGDQWDAGRIHAWRASVRVGAEELRALGCRSLAIVGVRLGATFALLDGAALGAEAIVAWAPVTSGRRYAKEIRLLSETVPAEGTPPGVGQAMVSAGSVFTEQSLEDIARLDLSGVSSPLAPRVLILDETRHEKLCEHLGEMGTEVEQRGTVGGESVLAGPAEYATVPETIVGEICDWVGQAPPGRGEPHDLVEREVASFAWNGSRITERVVQLSATQLVGVLTEPQVSGPDTDTVVFLNTGSETHVGPGRAWVEYARALAGLGHCCLRVDFRGWGESPDDGHAPGRPYDAHCMQDTITIIRALRDLGHERIVLVGLCASAWVALRAVLREPVAGVIALNPQMYWKMGDPVEATMAETRLNRTAARERERRGSRVGLWSALDCIGRRPWAARWLDDLSAADTSVVLVFAEGDDGIEFLRNRVGRRLRATQRAGNVRVAEVPLIDHAMHRAWLRPSIVRVLQEQVGLCLGESASALAGHAAS